MLGCAGGCGSGCSGGGESKIIGIIETSGGRGGREKGFYFANVKEGTRASRPTCAGERGDLNKANGGGLPGSCRGGKSGERKNSFGDHKSLWMLGKWISRDYVEGFEIWQ